MKKTSEVKQKPSSKVNQRPLLKKILFIAVPVTGIALAGATVFASNASKPGDPLYSIDRGVENLQLSLPQPLDSKADLRMDIAIERVGEAQAVLNEKAFDPAGLEAALANLKEQKAQIALLLAELKNDGQNVADRSKSFDDQFEQKENELKKSFKAKEKTLEIEKEGLDTRLKDALAANDNLQADRLRAQKAEVEKLLDDLDVREEALKEVLEAEEDRIEALMDAQELQKEVREEALEAQAEALEKQEEQLREQAEKAAEADKERLEQEAERVKAETEAKEDEVQKARESQEADETKEQETRETEEDRR